MVQLVVADTTGIRQCSPTALTHSARKLRCRINVAISIQDITLKEEYASTGIIKAKLDIVGARFSK